MTNTEPEEMVKVSEQTVQYLAKVNGLTILEDDLKEVTHRFQAMMNAAKAIEQLDLQGMKPIAFVPERRVLS